MDSEEIQTLNRLSGEQLLKRLQSYPQEEIQKVKSYGFGNLWHQQNLDQKDKEEISNIKRHSLYSILAIATANLFIKNDSIRTKINNVTKMDFFNQSLIGRFIGFQRGFLIGTLFSYYIASEVMVFIMRSGMKQIVVQENKS